MKNQAGFTMIEVIVTLVLVGIVALMGGMAIVQVTQGYIFTKDNAELTQKAQLATSRITKEIVEMTGISADATASTLPLKNNIRNVTIGLNAGSIKIAPDGTALNSGDILVDNVHAFTLTYYSKDNAGNWVANTSWSTASDIRNLIAVDISMQLPRTGGGYLTFQNRISPRNNKNQGGTVPTTPPPTAPSYGFGCFVATAAYGAPDHPMVMLLRDFRDRYLLTWTGGRWLAKQYYTHGPAAADVIRNRPVAMWAVRCLLAPLAALTFCLIYAPLAIPSLAVISLILTGALFSAGRRGQIKLPFLRFMNQRGSVLIGLIGTMVVMGVLGAAMLPILSASSMNQAFADQGRKTYFLAESGFRYAASQFLNVGTEAAKETSLTNLNNKTCNLSGNGGSFTIGVYPYWSKTSSVSGGTTLSTTIAGTNPSSTTPAKRNTSSGGYLRIGSDYYSFTNDSGSTGTTAVYTGLSPAMASVPATPVDVLPVVLPAGTQTVTNGGNLTLSATGAGAFPVFNGNFKLNGGGMVYSYEKRSGNTLINITLADSTKTWSNFTVTSGAITDAATTKIVLDKYLQISSTGTLGNNSREILYNVPVGWMAGGGEFQKKNHLDKMDNAAGWFNASGQAMGTHAVTGGAMQVSSVINPTTSGSGLVDFIAGLFGWGDNGLWGFIGFNWGNTETNLAQAWHDAGGCLSYDLQVKMNNTLKYFMTGIAFRMRNNNGTQADNTLDLYTYGVSVVRQRETRSRVRFFGKYGSWSNWDFNDDINPDLRPFTAVGVNVTSSHTIQTADWLFGTQIEARYHAPVILLWQRTGPPVGLGSFKKLAYRTITAADGLTTGSGTSLVLKPWVTLMVRLIEGYELPFNTGLVDAAGKHLKYGDIIINGTKSARIIGTPIMTTAWGGNNTTAGVGTLILTNVSGAFANGDNLYLEGGTTAYARASGGQAAAKKNYIMVYYSSTAASGTANTIQADNNRLANPRYTTQTQANWPPDDWTERTAANDYFSLIGGTTAAVRWTFVDSANLPVDALNTTDFYNAVIRTGALVSPDWTSTSTPANFNTPGDGVALVTSSSAPNTANTTYYDDFAIQLDMKAGTGFLPPIQQ
jgi:prepilin-type N-terminal cleavage/methylation domain-containing protein